MKFRIAILIAISIILSACNMSLAEDVTPPPGYIPPTPVPTLVLIPPQTPNVANGEAIYFEKCAPCHGETGLGDGPQGIQLGVTVPAFALPEVARPASPAAWYTVVTRGRIDRFMPPFVSLDDQERWDVVAYITTLHTTDEEIQNGKKIFEEICQDCPTDYFKDQGVMSGLSTVGLARIVRLGNDQVQAFGENLSDDEMWAVTEYLRSLTYDTLPPSAPVAAVPATQTPLPADSESASVEGTPVESDHVEDTSIAPPAVEGFGSVSGSIENQTGKPLPNDLTVTLRGYQHDFANPNEGTQEVLSIQGTVQPDGTFTFENVEMPEGRIFLAEVIQNGLELSSDFAIVEAGQTAVTVPPLILYDVTQDTASLTADELDLFITVDSEGNYEVLALHTFRNTGEAIVNVEIGDMQEIPFLKFPFDSQGLGYEAVQDSAPFISTADGFAMKPSETPYGIIAYSVIAREKETTILQPLILPVAVMQVFVPDGISLDSSQLTPDSPQVIQGDTYQAYFSQNLQAGETLQFTLSGDPVKNGTDANGSNNLLIGAAVLGVALLVAGAWMYMRDRNITNDDASDEEDKFESSKDVLDAIIALDDLYLAKKISKNAYDKRREELKDELKSLM